jgi:rare lipoprotein A
MIGRVIRGTLASLSIASTACVGVAADLAPAQPTPQSKAAAHARQTPRVQTGKASVYSDKFSGRKTASGQRYRRDRMTAAHRTLPLGTRVKVTNTQTGKSADVVINDRGPAPKDRIIDLSPAAAEAVGIDPKAMGDVRTEVVGKTELKPEH